MDSAARLEAPVRCRRVAFVRLPPFMGYAGHHPRDVTLPLTIAYTATMVRDSGRSVSILDVWAHDRSMDEVLEELRAAEPDVVFFEAHAAPLPVVAKCAQALRHFSAARLVAYGSVPTFNPERVVGPEGPIDVALNGESEVSSLALLDAWESGQALAEVSGLTFWDAARRQMTRTPARPELRDLDELPRIDYDLFDLPRYHKYSFPMPLHRKVRWGHVLATRGCPYPCTHCSFDHRQSFGRHFRRHSPRRVVDSLETLARRHGVNAISMEDDIFTLNRRYVFEICDEIERRGLDVKWIVQTRVDCLDRELVQRMKRAGCVGVSLGIESGNDRILELLQKGFTRAQALEGIRLCQEEGMMMRLLFMIGNPTETAAEIEDTIDLATQAEAITAQVHISTPYPGTGLLGQAEGDGRHIIDFSSYNEIVQNLSAVPDQELWDLHKKFYRKYYFSWRYVVLFMRQRVRFMAGSWRRDLPLVARTLFYLVWTSRRQGKRDMDSVFGHIAHTDEPARAGQGVSARERGLAASLVSIESVGRAAQSAKRAP